MRVVVMGPEEQEEWFEDIPEEDPIVMPIETPEEVPA